MPRSSRKNMARDPSYGALREYKTNVMTPATIASLGAHSVGIGRKVVDGEPTDKLSLRVYVGRKQPASALSGDQLVPETVRFMSRGAGREVRITTDVIETPPPTFEADPTGTFRPAPGGVSVDAISGTAGTLGGWVWDTTDDTIVMLSNHHIFGHTTGTDIIQPGPFDGGSTPADKIGDVKRGVPRSTTATNTVDCGIGDPDTTNIYDLSVLEIGPAVYAIDVAVLDLQVEKYGRTTEHTFGEITDSDYETIVDGLYTYDDCIRVDVVEPSDDWSAGGDSGSLVFSQTPTSSGSSIKPVVGLHFAGASTYGVGCKIQNVFDQLDLTTLCAGAFAAFLDSLFEAEAVGEVSKEAEARLGLVSSLAARAKISLAPPSFVKRERSNYRSRSLYYGISRDVQKRLSSSRAGRAVTDFVDSQRAELLTLLAKDGDVRRATIAALRPLVMGATTTTDVLERVFTDKDLKRMDKLAREVTTKASPELQETLKPLLALRGKAEGKSMARLLGLKL